MLKLHAVPMVFVALVATVSCTDAASRDICGSPKVKMTLAAMLLKSDTPHDLQGSAYNSLSIVVSQQKTDETGLHVYCAASINVKDAAIRGYYSKLSERDAKATRFAEMMGGSGTKVAGIHFMVSLDSKGSPSQIGISNDDLGDDTVKSVSWWLTNVVTGRP
jgi:hypothetical protein